MSDPIPTGPTNTEPLALKTVIERLAQTAVGGLLVFGVWHPTTEQMGWLMGAAALVGALLDSLVRLKVWSPASHARAVAEAEAKLSPDALVVLGHAQGRAKLADEIVAKLGPPPITPPPRSMQAGHYPPPPGPPPERRP